MGCDKIRSLLRQSLQIRQHIACTEGAVQTDCSNMCMLHGGKKGGQGLTGERAPALCGQGDGKHNGQVFPRFLQCLLYRF
ncbi:hypothetical protein Barb4_03647 [Bacteroidales bacterium Barb4]|nr:hypothetical protein Barb4_03647 [Bacteroidales bacterium Barb4]